MGAGSGLWGVCLRSRSGRAQASVNPKAETVEELQGRRKHLHMGMMKLAKQDLALALQAARDDDALVHTCPFRSLRPNHWLHWLC